MALAIEPNDLAMRGLVRVVTKRQGDVASIGFLDRSILAHAEPFIRPGRWEVGAPVNISGLEETVASIQPLGSEFIGLEDPDIIEEDGVTHLFCTIPFYEQAQTGSDNPYHIFLGHAKGTLDLLHMQQPVLTPRKDYSENRQPFIRGFKELCPAPLNSHGTRLHLVESNDLRHDVNYSTMSVVEADSYDGPWWFREDVVHPDEVAKKYERFSDGNDSYQWCSGHVSPCRLFDDTFLSLPNHRVGIMNGRSQNQAENYGRFLPGLFIYDPDAGTVPWVDPHPLFDDERARTIVFASDFIAPEDPESQPGVLLAHVDDSAVYAYRISQSIIYERIPNEFK